MSLQFNLMFNIDGIHAMLGGKCYQIVEIEF